MSKKKYAKSGFALGLILVVIALMAAITSALTIYGGDTSSHIADDKLRAYAVVVKSHGAHIRDTYKSLERTHGSVNTNWSCSGSNCLWPRVKLSRIPMEIFTSDPPSGTYGSSYWSVSGPAVFPSYSSTMFVLRYPIAARMCEIIESQNRNARVEAADIRQADVFALNGSGEFFLAQFSWEPTSQDGCFSNPNGVDGNNNARFQYYYYIMVGRA